MPSFRLCPAGRVVIGAVGVAILFATVLMEWQPAVSPSVFVTGDDDYLPRVLPAPILDNPKTPATLQTAVLAGGCFWGVQGVFEHVKGFRQVIAGY
jgi:hypothetical protein